MDPKRRLAQAVRAKTSGPETPYRSGTVTAVDTDAGTLTMTIPLEGGEVLEVTEVRHASSVSPQVGRQVSYVLNGDEPFVVSETGDVHDPVFDGRVVARSFHATPGVNLLEVLAAAGAPWSEWAGTGGTLTTGTTMELAVAAATAATMASPIVPVARTGRHYTGWVDMPDAGINSRAWVEVRAYDALGDLVATWGSFVDAVRLPGETLTRFPMPDANELLPASVTGLQLVVHVDAGTAGTASVTGAFLGTAPVFEGGAVLLGRTQIDQAGFRLDGEDLLSPWTKTIYTNGGAGYDELGGADWTVRHRRIGKTGFVECVGIIAGAATWAVPSELPLPYTSAGGSLGLLHGYVLDNGTRYYPVTAGIEIGDDVIRRIIHGGAGNGGTVNGSNPFTLGAGDQVRLSGSYEID